MRSPGCEWPLKHKDKDYGPLSHRELLLLAGFGKLSSADRLWAPGLPCWVPASFVILGLIKPTLTVEASALNRSWQSAVTFFRASWARMRQWRTGLHLTIDPRQVKAPIQLPVVWFGTAAGVVLMIIIASAQNSNRSFATSTPEISLVMQGSDIMPPLPVVTMPGMALGPLPETPPIEEANAEDAAVAERLTADETLPPIKEAVPIPDRKPEVARKSIDTEEGAKAVQRRLRQLGFFAGDADGTWGPKSRLALKQFLRRAHIPSSSGWSRRAERVLFSANAPRAISADHNPFLQASFYQTSR